MKRGGFEESTEALPAAETAKWIRGSPPHFTQNNLRKNAARTTVSKSVPIGGREQRTGIGRHDGEQMVLADKKKETAKAVSFW